MICKKKHNFIHCKKELKIDKRYLYCYYITFFFFFCFKLVEIQKNGLYKKKKTIERITLEH